MMKGDNYYERLGVPDDASAEEIRLAYLHLANLLHPDRLGDMPENIRERAEAVLKKVNVAYGILSNEARRKEYDRSQHVKIGSIPHFTQPASTKRPSQAGKLPKPEVVPKTVELRDVSPYIPQKTYFVIHNNGGACRKVLLSTPPSWLKITKATPVQSGTKLPMLVELECTGIDWGMTLSTKIKIKLDNRQTAVKVRLHTKRKTTVKRQ